MSIKIEKCFKVNAPVEKVWVCLTDPEFLANCLPGVQVTEVVDARTFKGQLALQVGPIEAKYEGEAHFEEVDEARYHLRMTAHGKGEGSASMIMSGQLRALDSGGTEATLSTEVNITGKLTQLGSRLINIVADQTFAEFIKRVKRRLPDEDVKGR